MKKEIRALKVDFRTKHTEESTVLSGMPIVYNRDSEDLGFIERISPGAVTEALEKSDVRLLWGHNSDTLLPLARTSAGTLRAVDGESGVEIEADMPNTQFAKDLAESIRRGDVQDMSFAFTVSDDEWETRDGQEVRTINKINELFDFSFVAYPAYQDTTVALRSLETYKSRLSPGDEVKDGLSPAQLRRRLDLRERKSKLRR